MNRLALCTLAAALFGTLLRLGAVVVTPADVYGGVGTAVASGNGFFRVEKNGSRWSLLSPEGHRFWMRAVYGVDWNDGGAAARAAVQSKYHGDPTTFAVHANQRLLAWGFNALGGYASSYALPVPTYFRPAGNATPLPFLRDLNIAWYAAIDSGGLAPDPIKTLLAGAVDPAVYRGWAGHVPDVFDPNFEIYARNAAADLATAQRQTEFTVHTASGGIPQPSLLDSPWLLASIPDDSDDLYGFGPGPLQPGAGQVVHPHIGWVVAVTRPTQSENTEVGVALGGRRTVRYRDPIVYAKAAWVEFLRHRYSNLAALNHAWDAHYTSFGSDGGWPNGRGLLDESGRNSWIGADAYGLTSATPAVRRDLDDFLALYADRYFQVVTTAIRAATPHQLIFSGVLDAFGGLSRPQVLQAAARYCDALQIVADPSRPQVLEDTFHLTGRPLFAWLGLRADTDSALDPNPADGGSGQARRGLDYAHNLDWLFQARVGGVAPIIGLDWWEYMDKPGEKANWGLVTPSDNAYDGHQDVRQPSRDSWGFAVGGERADFGDFLTSVTLANRHVDELLEAGR